MATLLMDAFDHYDSAAIQQAWTKEQRQRQSHLPTRPLIVFGDGPLLPSGLARIARDLTARIHAAQEMLGVRVYQVGVALPGGWHWQGWDFFGFQPSTGDQGRTALQRALQEIEREQRGAGQDLPPPAPVVLMITDPARAYDLLRSTEEWEEESDIDFHAWGYFPIDAHTPNGTIGGPAREAVHACDRVLGYGRWGAQVLSKTMQGSRRAPKPVPYLPHGIDTGVFRSGWMYASARNGGFAQWADCIVHPDTIKIGVVATNQPRKDYGLAFATVAALRARGRKVALWCHTDRMTGAAWDLSQLAFECGLQRSEVFISTEEAGPLPDTELAARYGWSTVTLAPGLGEGFGYPIVESLACGTPVIHGTYGGGTELVAEPRWLVRPTAWRLESPYVLVRPVYDPQAWADAVEAAARMAAAPWRAAACAGAVSHLDWAQLWPRWHQWLQDGLRDLLPEERT